MLEEKEELNLVSILKEKGYADEEALKCVVDVLDARKILRDRELRNYLGKRVRADFEGLLFEVIVKDVKIDADGRVQFQVTPLNGSRCAWVKRIVL